MNTFKWRLLENGVDTTALADEVTQRLVRCIPIRKRQSWSRPKKRRKTQKANQSTSAQ